MTVQELAPAAIVHPDVPPSAPVPVLSVRATTVLAPTFCAVLVASCACTTTLNATARVGLVPPLTLVMASLVGGCGAALTVKVALLPATRTSPLERVAVRVTPASATEYVTPVTVQELDPAVIVHPDVPPSAPVPVLRVRATTVLATTFCAVLVASCACTTTLNATARVGLAPPLTLVIASLVGGTTALLTVNVALVPGVSESPLVRVAVRLTPASATEYVTPVTVQELDPAVIVHPSVPPSAPVPVARVRATTVLATTFCAVLVPSCACTITLKPTPTVGLVPPLTLVMASLVGGGGVAALTVNGALLPGVSESPLERVAVRLTPASALEYVAPMTVQELAPAAIVHPDVPPSAPVPVLRVRATTVLATTFCAVLVASCACTTTLNATARVGLAPPLTLVIASLVGGTTALLTVNVALVPGVSESPLVRVAVRLTPASATEYVTPVTVQELDPAVIVHPSVPPSAPVPVARVRATTVLATTFCAVLVPSCACTITLKPTPTVGLVPPLTLVIASLVGGTTALLTVNVALVPGVSESPLVRVAVRLTPASATEYVTPVTVQELDPAVIVHPSVPPSAPVPVARVRATTVLATTFCAVLVPSCACTITLKPTPTVGLVPPLTLVIASLVGGSTALLTANVALLPGVSESPLVPAARTSPLERVTVRLTPASATE